MFNKKWWLRDSNRGNFTYVVSDWSANNWFTYYNLLKWVNLSKNILKEKEVSDFFEYRSNFLHLIDFCNSKFLEEVCCSLSERHEKVHPQTKKSSRIKKSFTLSSLSLSHTLSLSLYYFLTLSHSLFLSRLYEWEYKSHVHNNEDHKIEYIWFMPGYIIRQNWRLAQSGKKELLLPLFPGIRELLTVKKKKGKNEEIYFWSYLVP